MTGLLALYNEGAAQAATLIAALAKHGVSLEEVTVERGQLTRVQHREIRAATGVLIILTEDDRFSPAMLDAARIARPRNVITVATLSRSIAPPEMMPAPVFNLGRWRGAGDNPTVLALAGHLRSVAAISSAATRKRGFRRVLIGGSVGGFATVAFSFIGADLFNLQQQVCGFPEPKPWAWLSDTCGVVGLGDRPTRRERLAWEAREPASCEALVSHIRRFPAGKLTPQAHALYAARSRRETGKQITTIQSLPLFVEVAPEGGDNRLRALARGAEKAARHCDLYAADLSVRVLSARVTADRWQCSDTGCSFEGVAVCELATQEVVETCPAGV